MASNVKKKQYTPAELRQKAEELTRCDTALQIVNNEVSRAIEENESVDEDLVMETVSGILEQQEQGVDSLVRGIHMLSRKVDNIGEEKNLIQQLHKLEERRLNLIKAKVSAAIEGHFADAGDDVKHRMEGALFSLWTQSTGKDKVVIVDPTKIPAKFHRFEVTIQIEDGETGEQIYDMLESVVRSAEKMIKIGIRRGDGELQKSWVGEALRKGEDVPGAVLRDADKHLRMTSTKKVESTLDQINKANAIEGPVVDATSEAVEEENE